jgi:acyl dehydratase
MGRCAAVLALRVAPSVTTTMMFVALSTISATLAGVCIAAGWENAYGSGRYALLELPPQPLDRPMRTIAIADLPKLVGEALPPSPWRKIDQALVNQFADVTDDHQWIHVDVERAKKEIGAPIAHGFLTLSLMSAMSAETMKVTGVGRGINYGFEKLRFTGVVPVGSRVRMTSKIASVDQRAGGYLVTRACAIEVELPDGTMAPRPAVVADWLGLLFPA